VSCESRARVECIWRPAVGVVVGILRLRRDFASLVHGSAQDDNYPGIWDFTDHWQLATDN
jgi:hypothetical protein